jgi:hypothetical protein
MAPAADGATIAFDFAQALPLVTDVTVDLATPARPTITWVAAGAFVAAQGGFARTVWSTVDDAGASVEGGWSFVFPAATPSVHAPELPASLAAWLPDASAQTSFVGFLQVDGVASYEALLTRWPSLLPRNFAGGLSLLPPILPAGVAMRASFAHING